MVDYVAWLFIIKCNDFIHVSNQIKVRYFKPPSNLSLPVYGK